MPKAIKKRITKKPIVKEDEVKDTAKRAIDFVKGERKSLIIISSVVIAAVVLGIVFISYTSSLKKKALSLENEAYNYYYGINLKGSMTDGERWQKSLELYKKSVETRVTPTALFYLGNSFYHLGDYNNAIKEYSAFINKFRNEEEILPLVYQKLASAYFKSDKSDKAFETLNALAQFKNGIFKDTALILEARYYETAGDSKKAMERYKELIKEFPASPWSAEANARIAREKAEDSEK